MIRTVKQDCHLFVSFNQKISFKVGEVLLSPFNNITSQKMAFMFGGNLTLTEANKAKNIKG